MSFTLTTRIIAGALGSMALAVAAGLLIQRNVIRQQGIELTRNTMRAALLEAENVRESVSTLGNKGAFDRARLVQEVKLQQSYTNATLYGTIPVVAAWKAIAKVAEQEGYEFRVSKHQARNPNNLPRPDEEAILTALETGRMPEYFHVDRARNEIVYARPIVLTADCAACHGDPKTSLTGDGKDPTGGPMENWKTGEVHGAFILKSSLDHLDGVVRASMAHTLLLVLPMAVVIGIGFLFLNRRHITKPLNHTIEALACASAETTAAANEVSSGSQAVAQGACEQAASLEEASAALEELSSMTRRNNDHAAEARAATVKTCKAAEDAAVDMRSLSAAMQQLEEASGNIAKIIKVIDEIAFQTNLLALNASVEAARAGDAGLGFAVVADEVRALAKRCSLAATETGQIIQDSIAKTNRGKDLNGKVSLQLENMVAMVKSVDELVEQISQATKEQTLAISQINEVVSQIDQTTQRGAAGAEETASAVQELHAQAQSIQACTVQLAKLVYSQAHAPAVNTEAPQPADRPAPRPARLAVAPINVRRNLVTPISPQLNGRRHGTHTHIG